MRKQAHSVVKGVWSKKYWLIVVIPPLAIWLVFLFMLGGFPTRVHKLAYLGPNFEARKYQLTHLSIKGSKTKSSYEQISLPVLLYHGIEPELSNNQKADTYEVTARNFARQMIALKQAGYTTVTTQDLANYYDHKKPLPQKSIMVTFDDGRKDSYYGAQTILAALHFKAVMFVILNNSLNQPGGYYLNKNELLAMKRSGIWDLQSHSFKGHVTIPISKDGQIGDFYADKMWLKSKNRLEADQEFNQRVDSDLATSAQKIKQYFGYDPVAIAYPFGDTGQNSDNYKNASKVVLANSQKYFRFGFVQWWPSQGYSQNLLAKYHYIMKRINIAPDLNSQRLMSMLNNGSLINLPYAYQDQNVNSFVNLWGDVATSSNQLLVSASADATGGGVVLDGSQPWKNFWLTTQVVPTKTENIALVMRYNDNENYLACSFDNQRLSIIEVSQNQTKILLEKDLPNPILDGQPQAFSAGMKNGLIQCGLNDTRIAKIASLSDSFRSGEVGFFTYQHQPGQSKVLFKDLRVIPS